jgi:hypothetical protein
MASELAKKIYQLEWGQIDVIDAELQEVRELLSALAYEAFQCDHSVMACSSTIVEERARALMEKLEVRP